LSCDRKILLSKCIKNATICSGEAGTKSFASPSTKPLVSSCLVCATSTVLQRFIGLVLPVP
jgi:hypothetical protein